MLEWTGQLVKHGSKLEEIEIAIIVDEGEKDGEEYFFDDRFEDRMESDGEGEYYAVNIESDNLIDPENLKWANIHGKWKQAVTNYEENIDEH